MRGVGVRIYTIKGVRPHAGLLRESVPWRYVGVQAGDDADGRATYDDRRAAPR